MKTIEQEILELSYWEHFKYSRDANNYPVGYNKRKEVADELSKIAEKIKAIDRDAENKLRSCG